MGELLNQLLAIILSQGLAGAIIIVLGYAYYKKDKEIKALNSLLLEAAETDNHEKIEYLNQHLVLLTKSTESMATTNLTLTEVRAKQEQLGTAFAELKGKLDNG